MPAYYNELDPYAAQWLRNLITAKHLPAGDVDERSILDVQPEDLNGYEQCHFFAGIGVWPYALRRIGWPDNRGIWSGSCPCQPFSAAGRQLGFADERHLWPAWFHLITQRRPSIVVGEQVASALDWLDIVSNDLEGAGYAFGAADLCAAGYPVEGWHESPQHEWLLRAVRDCPDPVVAGQLLDFAAWASGNLGAHDGDHIRQRLYFVGLADTGRPCGERGPDARGPVEIEARHRQQSASDDKPRGSPSGLADSPTNGRGKERTDGGGGGEGNSPQGGSAGLNASRGPIRLEHGKQSGLEGYPRHGDRSDEPRRLDAEPNGPTAEAGTVGRANATNERRGAADWLFCRDGKWRPVRPGTFPLANAPAGRVGRLRAYGNALDAQTVVEFLTAVRGCIP